MATHSLAKVVIDYVSSHCFFDISTYIASLIINKMQQWPFVKKKFLAF